MMFQADAAFAAELIALVAGTFLLVWVGRKEDVCCKGFAKVVAYFTIIAAIFALLCTSYYSIRYWEDGYFRSQSSMGVMQGMSGMGMMGHGMMGKGMMKDCPMMEMMKQQMMQKGQEAEGSESHH